MITMSLGTELQRALEQYRRSLQEETTEEEIVQRALKRFLLQQGYPVEDEALSEEELIALREMERGEVEYEDWQVVKERI